MTVRFTLRPGLPSTGGYWACGAFGKCAVMAFGLTKLEAKASARCAAEELRGLFVWPAVRVKFR